MSSAFKWATYWIIEIFKWKHPSGHIIRDIILQMKTLRPGKVREFVQGHKTNSCKSWVSPKNSHYQFPAPPVATFCLHMWWKNPCQHGGQWARLGVVFPCSLTISHVFLRLCIQWGWWIFCLRSECQRLRLGDHQVHESRWCQRASRCAWKSQVQLYGLDPWREGDVLQCIPAAGWEKWW